MKPPTDAVRPPPREFRTSWTISGHLWTISSGLSEIVTARRCKQWSIPYDREQLLEMFEISSTVSWKRRINPTPEIQTCATQVWTWTWTLLPTIKWVITSIHLAELTQSPFGHLRIFGRIRASGYPRLLRILPAKSSRSQILERPNESGCFIAFPL